MVDPDITVHMLRTYVNLRRLMTVVTFVFLATLTIYRLKDEADTKNRDSISAYYYHDDNDDFPMKVVFAAALSAMGLLLVAYQGYTDQEKWILNLGGAALVLVVFFPMDDPTVPVAHRSGHATVHYASAVVFFLSLACVSLWRSHDTLALVTPRRRRIYRNVYRVTGGMMLFVPVLAIAIALNVIHFASAVYWVEFIGVVAFLSYWVG